MSPPRSHACMTTCLLLLGMTALCRAALSPADWAAAALAVGVPVEDLEPIREHATTHQEVLALTNARLTALGVKKLMHRKRLRKWATAAEAQPSATGGGLRTASERWTDSEAVEEIHASEGMAVLKLLQKRSTKSPPLVIRGAMAKNKELLDWGSLRGIANAQGEGFTFSGVKMSDKSPQMVFFKNAMKWLGDLDDSTRGSSAMKHRVRPMHRWRYAELKPKEMFAAWDKGSAPPHVYWLQKLPKGLEPGIKNVEICKLYMPFQRDCADEESPQWSIWANSAGVVAQAHYDLEAVIFVQVGGLKKFTFWQPDDIGKLCMFPAAYPGQGQSQIDHDPGLPGGGKEAPCRYPPAHNRTVLLEAGDVLLVSPMYTHRVEAISATVSMAYNANTPYAVAHLKISGMAVKTMIKLTKLARVKGAGTKVAAAAHAIVIRLLLKAVLPLVPGAPASMREWLEEHWQDWAMLRDQARLGVPDSEESLAARCALEDALTPKLAKNVAKVAQRVADTLVKAAQSNAQLENGLRFTLGTFVLGLHAGIREQPRQLLDYDQTRAWYESIWRCGAARRGDAAGQRGARAEEL